MPDLNLKYRLVFDKAYVAHRGTAAHKEQAGLDATIAAVLDDLEAHILAGIPSGDHWSRRALDKIREMRG